MSASRQQRGGASLLLLIDALWRAAAYCLHRRVILFSLAPVVLIGGLVYGLGYVYWDSAIDAVRDMLYSQGFAAPMSDWLTHAGLGGLAAMVAPLVVVFLATPVIVLLSLLAVAMFMTPAMLKLVALRRFPTLERRHGGSYAASILGGLGAALMAGLALLASIPLWFIPPLALIAPALIWGWLTYRVMSYDVLAEHATKVERRELIRRHRFALFGIGVTTGMLSAAPSVVWVSMGMFLVMAPVLVPVAIWIYTLVFAFSGLWFAHYALAALEAMRAESDTLPAVPFVAGSPDELPVLPPL
ncbi:MAG: hypothetical protein RLZZ618_1730 [Pseudomonadota bacterium]